VAGIFVLQAAGTVFTVFAAVFVAGAAVLGNAAARSALAATDAPGLTNGIVSGAALVAGGFTVVGVVALGRSRLRAYRAFELAVLVDLLLAQPFSLLDAGFAGLVDVSIDLVLLAVLTYMQAQERRLTGWAPPGSAVPSSKRDKTSGQSRLRTGWVLAGALGGLLISLATPLVVITAYGLGLGLFAGGSPAQSAVDAFWNSALGWLLLVGAALGAVGGAALTSWKCGSRAFTASILVGALFSALLLLSIPLMSGDAGSVLVRVAEVMIVCGAVGLLARRRKAVGAVQQLDRVHRVNP
jgi:hypothetical protein